jgi:ATP-dependent DNA helicase DinG
VSGVPASQAEFGGLAGLLGAAGPLARSLEGFRPRVAQQRMASRIELALHTRELLLVEAGTGTGKTFAYLVPALLSGLRVLISTGTRTLQDQLYHRDLPLLAGALGRPARVALLKGRSNYLCRARWLGFPQQGELIASSRELPAGQLARWASSTHTGDLAELPGLADADALRGQLSSTRESCTGTRCAEFSRCHVVQARRAALDADIVIVNHHLLLADLALKEDGVGDLLPSVDAVILDEAHQLPDLASEVFGISVSSRQIDSLIGDLRTELRAAGLAREALRFAGELEGALERARYELTLGRGAGASAAAGWPEDDARVQRCLQDLEQTLVTLAEELEAQAEAPGPQQCALRARALSSGLSQIRGDEEGGAGARTIEVLSGGFALRWLPYEISSRFRALIARSAGAWVFTSATLAVGANFDHFSSRLGLEQAATLRLESPFDYQRQGLLYLPRGLPQPSDALYTDALIDAMLPLLEASGGGAFVLFTSHRALRRAAERLAPLLPPELPLLVQGTEPREQLLRRFRASSNAVLLGSASFWEGVDVQGSALRLVIIDKLPFASPEDPIVRARIEHLRAQGASPFALYQLPEAVLALKQGVGRLIRSEQDRGVVVICDPRITERGYGAVFRASLPPMPVTREREQVLRALHELRAAS